MAATEQFILAATRTIEAPFMILVWFTVGVVILAASEWTRLAVAMPPMLPSLNQIGFDYMDWIVGVVEEGEPDASGDGRCILWAIGGRRDENGMLVADPESDFALPLSGIYRGDAFVLTNRRFTMEVTGIPIPFNLFQLRGQLVDCIRGHGRILRSVCPDRIGL